MCEISVVVCTHNRIDHLRESIASLCNQTLDKSRYEILIVDNASSDGTHAWIQDQVGHASNIVAISQPALGLSNARNAGWRAARSEIVAFLDDDATAAGTWLETILEKFKQRNDPRLGAIGGKVELRWHSPCPEWLIRDVWTYLGFLDCSTHDIVLTEGRTFIGCNMAIRRSVLEQLGGFSVALGRKGRVLLSNEEIYLQKRLETAGYYALYSPDALAWHSVHAERMSRAWFRRRCYWQGLSNAVLAYLVELNGPRGISAAASFKRNIKKTVRFVQHMLCVTMARKRFARGIEAERDEFVMLGEIVGDWRLFFQDTLGSDYGVRRWRLYMGD